MTPLDVNSGDTAWILTSAALVMLMTPGLALFYGGMTRRKAVLNMMMMSFAALAVVSVLWVLYGYSMAFGNDIGGGLLGNPLEHLGLQDVLADDGASLPTLAFVGFQAVFAIITVALISGAIADRAKFGTWLVFIVIWATIVYFPIAHWVFDFDADGHVGGWIANTLKALDFAGGTAVHINAGAAGLALALVLGARVDFRSADLRPHNMPFVMLGAGLLWFGWFGFNAGSALTAGNTAAFAWVNTLVATGAATLGWLFTERIRDKHFTPLGAASGVVAGLVAITPAANSVSPVGAIALGILAGVLCCLAVGLKFKIGVDDSLDVVGVHLVGGLVGTLAIGFLATDAAPAGVNGLLYGGGVDQLWRQAVGAITVLVVSFGVTWLIAIALQKTMGFRAEPDAELAGVDAVFHGSAAYDEATASPVTAPSPSESDASGDPLPPSGAEKELTPA